MHDLSINEIQIPARTYDWMPNDTVFLGYPAKIVPGTVKITHDGNRFIISSRIKKPVGVVVKNRE